MKKLIFMSVAGLGLAATPALAANAYWSGSTPMSFGPSETRTQGIMSTPYPQKSAAVGDTEVHPAYPHDNDLAPTAQAKFAAGDMDSDSGPSAAD